MKVMCVDDDPDVVFILEQILLKCGADVVGLTKSNECLPTVRKEMPDLIFLDVMMPEIDGWEICKKIKDDPETSRIFISMLTVMQGEEDQRRSLEYARANQHLTKPINLGEIRNIVEDFGNPPERLF